MNLASINFPSVSFHISNSVWYQFSRVWLCDPMDYSAPDFPVLHYLLEFAQTNVHWVSDTIQISYPLLTCPPALSLFPALGSCPVSWLFTSDGQSIEASASASVLPVNIQDLDPFRLIGLISLLSKGLSRIFSGTSRFICKRV